MRIRRIQIFLNLRLDSDQQVMAFVTERYGDFVLLKPPLKTATVLLWFGPLLIFLLGTGALARYYANRRRRGDRQGDAQKNAEGNSGESGGEAKPLSGAEKERLQSLLKEGGVEDGVEGSMKGGGP